MGIKKGYLHVQRHPLRYIYNIKKMGNNLNIQQ